MYILKSPVALATAVVAGALVTFQMSDANATTYFFDWSFSGGGSSGSGTMQATYDGGNEYTATSISGTVNGQTILGLSSYAGADQEIFYNISAPPPAAVDSNGVAFSVGTGATSYDLYDNVFSGANSPWNCGGVYCLDGPGNTSNNGSYVGDPLVAVNFSLVDPPPPAATPLPAALPLFGTGLGVVGFLAQRRKRKNATAIAAV